MQKYFWQVNSRGLRGWPAPASLIPAARGGHLGWRTSRGWQDCAARGGARPAAQLAFHPGHPTCPRESERTVFLHWEVYVRGMGEGERGQVPRPLCRPRERGEPEPREPEGGTLGQEPGRAGLPCWPRGSPCRAVGRPGRPSTGDPGSLAVLPLNSGGPPPRSRAGPSGHDGAGPTPELSVCVSTDGTVSSTRTPERTHERMLLPDQSHL